MWIYPPWKSREETNGGKSHCAQSSSLVVAPAAMQEAGWVVARSGSLLIRNKTSVPVRSTHKGSSLHISHSFSIILAMARVLEASMRRRSAISAN